MFKIITNYRKLFIKVLKNDFEGYEGGKIEKTKDKNDTFEEKAGEIIASVKGKLELLKLSIEDSFIGKAVEKVLKTLTKEQKKSAIGLGKLIAKNLFGKKNDDNLKFLPPLVAGARA